MGSLTQLTNGNKLGELFTASGIIDSDILANALVVADKGGILLGRVLKMSGYIQERELDAAIQLQSMIRQGVIGADLGQRALREVHIRKLPATQVLENFGWVKKATRVPLTQMAVILLNGNVVSREALDRAIDKSSSSDENISIGQALIMAGSITPSNFCSVIRIQNLIAAQLMSVEVATAVMHSIQLHRLSLDKALERFGLTRLITESQMTVAHLIAAAGIISDLDAAIATEQSLNKVANAIEALISSSLIGLEIGEDAAVLHSMILDGSVTVSRAVELLKLCAALNVRVKEIIAELDRLTQAVNLLIEAQIITDEQVSQVANANPDLDVCQALVDLALISENNVLLAIKCLSLEDKGLAHPLVIQALQQAINDDIPLSTARASLFDSDSDSGANSTCLSLDIQTLSKTA